MSITSLDHVNITTTDLDKSVAFYVEILGLKLGERPPFDFPGAWLYAGSAPIVHLVVGKPQTPRHTGPIDHVALRGYDFLGLKERLRDQSIDYEERDIPDSDLHQIFVYDPDGVKVEINFSIEN